MLCFLSARLPTPSAVSATHALCAVLAYLHAQTQVRSAPERVRRLSPLPCPRVYFNHDWQRMVVNCKTRSCLPTWPVLPADGITRLTRPAFLACSALVAVVRESLFIIPPWTGCTLRLNVCMPLPALIRAKYLQSRTCLVTPSLRIPS